MLTDLIRHAASVILLLVAGSSCHPLLASSPKLAKQFFGHIKTLTSQSDADSVVNLLRNLDSHCPVIDDDCDDATQVLTKLFGDTYRPQLPDLIVLIENNGNALTATRPTLMWNAKNTPYIYGKRHLYVIVFTTADPITLSARVTTIYVKPKNPLTALLSAASYTAQSSPEKKPDYSTQSIIWEPLSGNSQDPWLWVGYARLPIGLESINRVTVFFPQPTYTLTIKDPTHSETVTVEDKDIEKHSLKRTTTMTVSTDHGDKSTHEKIVNNATKKTTSDTRTDTATGPDRTGHLENEELQTAISPELTRTEIRRDSFNSDTIDRSGKMEGYYPLQQNSEPVKFRAINAHFSNSNGSYAGFSVAVGVTLDAAEEVKRTVDGAVEVEKTENALYNGYALAKIYLPTRRPRLQVEQNARMLYRPSLGFVVGTNVIDGPFEELVLGLSYGHLVGSAGLIVGANRVPRTDEEGSRTRWRLIVGMEYTF